MTEHRPDILFSDIKMPFMTGLELAEMVKKVSPETVIIIFSGYSDFEYARGAIKYGAFDYLLKPVSYEEAEALLTRADDYFAAQEKAQEEELAIETEPETGNEQFNALLQYMREHFSERLQLKELAKAFYLNPNYCSELFNKKLSISFSRYLNQLRIDQCCTLLRTSAKSAEEIAAQAGFTDSTHFHKVFKSITGETPGQYRKKREKQ